MYASVKYWVWLADLLPPAAGHRVYAFFQSPTEAFLSDNGRYDLIPGNCSVTPAWIGRSRLWRSAPGRASGW